MNIEQDKQRILKSLEDLKAQAITVIDVQGKTTVTDWLIIATGSSSRHVKSIAKNVVIDSKTAGKQPLGEEGEQDGEWVLIDLGDIIVHIMQQQVRELYDLEGLWSVDMVSRAENN